MADATRPWLAHYPPGVPAEIDMAALRPLSEEFTDCCERYADHPALESFGVRLNYRQYGEAARRVAAALQASGLKKGDRVALMMPNVMAYPPAIFGVLLAGCAVVNVNPLYTARELTHQVNDSGASIILVLENFAHTVAEALPAMGCLQRVIVVAPGDLLGAKGLLINLVSRYVKRAVKSYDLPQAERFSAFLARGDAHGFTPVALDRDDVAFLQYTGGTTGVSKGATLLHRNIAANVTQCAAWMRPFMSVEPGNVMITALPLYHVLALTGCCLFMMRIGAMQVLIANPRDIPALVKTIASARPSMIVMVNTLYNALATAPGFADIDFSRLRVCISGGMATQQAVARRWKETTGKPIVEGYGLSETSPVVCVNRLDIAEFTGAIGYPLSSTDVSIRNVENGGPTPLGEAGELCVKGPQVMAGYWKRPEETAKVMTQDGYFRTGDIAVQQPDGLFKIVDRMKDMIAVSGLKVFPNEVEDVLASHPKVLEAAVIGVPDSHSGEAVAAFVVPTDDTVTVEELREFARHNLAPYKVPRRIEFRKTLPKTNVGKVLRRELRDEVVNQAVAAQ